MEPGGAMGRSSEASRGHFADRLIGRLRAAGHPLCVGLDPHLERLPAAFRRGTMTPRDPTTAAAVESFLAAVIDRVAGRVAVVKPQIAFFEQLGWRGLRVLERLVARARNAGLAVILDAKRGDVGSTAAAYARAYLERDAATPVDAMTVNPYLGRDSLEPLIAAADAAGGGLFVLVKTSNPGARDFQDLELRRGRLYEAVARALAPAVSARRGPQTGYSALGVVAGATHPAESERLRALVPEALFLVPGYGAQGASAADAVRGFVRGPGGMLEGGVVNSSRAILFPGSPEGGVRRFEQAFDDALKRAIDELAAAVA